MPARSCACACATTGARSCSKAQASPPSVAPVGRGSLRGTVLRTVLQGGDDPRGVGKPGWSLARVAWLFRGAPDVRERKAVARQAAFEQCLIAAGARSAPGREPARGLIGIAVRLLRRREVVRQQFVDGGCTQNQALAKRRNVRVSGRNRGMTGRIIFALRRRCGVGERTFRLSFTGGVFVARNSRENRAFYLHKSAICRTRDRLYTIRRR